MSQNRPILSQFCHRGLERALSLVTCYSDTIAKSGYFSCLGERVDTELSSKPKFNDFTNFHPIKIPLLSYDN